MIRSRFLTAGIVMTIVIGTLVVVSQVAIRSGQGRPTATTCQQVVTQFKSTFPIIYREAGSPSISCVNDPTWHGAGGTNCQDHHIAINERFSDLAKRSHLTDKVPYWRELLAHEDGHMWACLHGLDSQWSQYERLRGFTSEDVGVVPTGVPQEDYAETFAYSLGWYECFGGAPFCFQNSAGHPTSSEISALESAGMLPTPH